MLSVDEIVIKSYHRKNVRFAKGNETKKKLTERSYIDYL